MNKHELIDRVNDVERQRKALKCNWRWYIGHNIIVAASIDILGHTTPSTTFRVHRLTSDSRRDVGECFPVIPWELMAVCYLRERWDLWVAGDEEDLPDENQEPDWKLINGEWQTVWPDGNPWLEIVQPSLMTPSQA